MREKNKKRVCEISILQDEVLLGKQNTQAKVSNELVNTTQAESDSTDGASISIFSSVGSRNEAD